MQYNSGSILMKRSISLNTLKWAVFPLIYTFMASAANATTVSISASYGSASVTFTNTSRPVGTPGHTFLDSYSITDSACDGRGVILDISQTANSWNRIPIDKNMEGCRKSINRTTPFSFSYPTLYIRLCQSGGFTGRINCTGWRKIN
jgi:hypothetical protein